MSTSQLSAFMSQARALSGRALSVDEATRFIGRAELIAGRLGC